MNRYIQVSTRKRILLYLVLLSVSFSNSYAQNDGLRDTLNSIPIEEKVGQMIMVGIRGTHLNAEAMDLTRTQIVNGDIGGIIFFKHNIKNSRQFRIFVKSLRDLQVDQPLFLAQFFLNGLDQIRRRGRNWNHLPIQRWFALDELFNRRD